MAAHSSDFSRYLAAITHKQAASSPAWQREAGKNEEGGLNAKGRASYNKATGGNLKAPVTEKNPKGDRAKRQNSFCARMCGMKRVNTGGKTKKDPDSRINKSLRKWNCKCGSEKSAKAYVADPLVPGALGLAGGGIVGALNAPPGELLKYILGGAGIGGSVGLAAGTGRSLGAHAANSLVTNQGLTGNSAAAAELGLPIAGILGGGLLSLPLVRRIEAEIAHKSNKEEEKQAMLPGVIGGFAGAAGGALTGKKNKINRAIGRGALIGAATELGMAPGMILGTIPGMLIGNAIAGPQGIQTGAVLGGGLGMGAGGMLGNAAAQGLLGPYETEEELAQELEQEKQEEQKMAAFEFGRKLAADNNISQPTPPRVATPQTTRPNHVVMSGSRPELRLDNFFEADDYERAAEKARPISRERTDAAIAAQNKFRQTWNPVHLGSAVGKTVGGLGTMVGEGLYNQVTNNPEELAFQNTHYDIAKSERMRDLKAQQQAQAQQQQNPGFFARMMGAKPTPQEPNIFEEELGNVGFVKAQSAFDFGRKVATVTMCDAPKHNDQSGVDVNPVAAGTPEGKEKLTKKKAPVKAEDVVTSKAALFGRKLAQSLVNFVERKPKDLTKGTLNPRAAGEQEEDTAEPENEEDDGLIV